MAEHNLSPAYLRCEYKVDPLGIDVKRPRLSWIVQSDSGPATATDRGDVEGWRARWVDCLT